MPSPIWWSGRSQEVRYKCLVWNGTGGLISQSMENVESLVKLLIDIQNRSNVTASVAVVGC